MARSGRFGRLPRAAPNLTSTIVSLLREYAAQQDTNIFDAWENGGEFEGKPVTDDMLLKHIKTRRDDLDPSDPMWDRWNVMLDNYTFSIEESKMSLRYAQHKVNETQMAQFYKTWAGKLPVNSEAYRNLMRSAAQFMDAAKSRAGGGGGGGGGRGGRRSGGDQAAYNSEVMSAYERNERAYDEATQMLLAAAYREGILQITDTADPDDLMDLRGGDEADHARFLNLFDQINTDPRFADIRTALAEAGMENLTYGRWLELGDSKQAGIEARIGIAVRYGDDSGAEDLREDFAVFNTERAIFNDIDETAAYSNMRRQFNATLAQPGLTPWEVKAAMDRYAAGLGALDASAASDQTRGFLNNELAALRGDGSFVGPTAYEMNEGGIRKNTTSDAGALQQLAMSTNQQIRAVESGQALMLSEADAEGNRIVARNTPGLSDPNSGMIVWTIPGKGVKPVPTYVQFRPIMVAGAGGADPNTGRPTVEVAAGGDQLLGQYYVLNGQTFYGVYGQGGDLTWFADDPFLTADRQVGADGTLMLRVKVPTGIGPDGQPTVPETFDPRSVLDPTAMDTELPRSTRFDNPDEALYYTDRDATRALLQVDERQVAGLLVDVFGESGAIERYENFRAMRDTAVGLANREYGLIEMENARLGLGPDPEMTARTAGLGARTYDLTPLSAGEQAAQDRLENSEQEWERRYQQTRVRTMTSGSRPPTAAPRPSQPVDPRTGLPLPSDVTPTAPGPSKNQMQIRVPNIDPAQLPGRGPQPIDLRKPSVKPVKTAASVGPQYRMTGPAPKPLVTPRPAPRPSPTPTSPRPIDDYEEPSISTPNIPTPDYDAEAEAAMRARYRIT
jgi:hypothetical protein